MKTNFKESQNSLKFYNWSQNSLMSYNWFCWASSNWFQDYRLSTVWSQCYWHSVNRK